MVTEGGGGGGGEREFWDPNKVNLTAIVSCKVSATVTCRKWGNSSPGVLYG